jgi:hypothetical protein
MIKKKKRQSLKANLLWCEACRMPRQHLERSTVSITIETLQGHLACGAVLARR